MQVDHERGVEELDYRRVLEQLSTGDLACTDGLGEQELEQLIRRAESEEQREDLSDLLRTLSEEN